LERALAHLRDQVRIMTSKGGRSAWRDEYLELSARLALERDAKDAQAHIRLGHVLRTRGDLEGAINAYRKGIALESRHDPHSHLALGQALMYQGQLTDARDSFRRAKDLF